jgi:membrane-bound inhibitor of C-type lysozyme
MNSGKTTIPGALPVASALPVAGTLLALAILFGASPAPAQTTTWQTYRCGDGSEFIVGFFGYDKRAHMQVDGKAVTLEKRIALTGSRYSGGGVTLRVTKSGTTFKIGKRPATSCQLT